MLSRSLSLGLLRRRAGVTMVEVMLVLAVGALVAIGAAIIAIDVMGRVQASNRSNEFKTVISTVRRQFPGVSYAQLHMSSIAAALPDALTNRPKSRILLGAGSLPIALYPGGDSAPFARIGAHGTQTFVAVVGSAHFPLKSARDCLGIAGAYGREDSELRGIQLRTAAGMARRERFVSAIIAEASASTLTASVISGGVGADAATLIAVADPGSLSLFDRAGPFSLRTLTKAHLRHACRRLTEQRAGAVIVISFT